MKKDPVVEEVRKAREQIFKESGYDLKKMLANETQTYRKFVASQTKKAKTNLHSKAS